jgi:hypothetical protein
MSIKTERITILGSPEFKNFLTKEAKKEGISVSQLVRDRCRRKAADEDEEILLSLVDEVRSTTKKAKKALDKGLKDAEMTLKELHKS